MVGEMRAIDWARTVGKPSAFLRSPVWPPGHHPTLIRRCANICVSVPMALTSFLSS